MVWEITLPEKSSFRIYILDLGKFYWIPKVTRIFCLHNKDISWYITNKQKMVLKIYVIYLASKTQL